MRILHTLLLLATLARAHAQGSSCDLLQADFGSFSQGLGVELVNSSFGLGTQTSYYWTFGDGQSSTETSPSHTYGSSGTYQVCLTVVSLYTGPTTTITCQDIYCAPVIILGEQTCSPNFLVLMGAQPQGNGLVSFVATSNFPNTNFIWYFGDGTQASGPNVDHVYEAPGSYSVCVAGWYWNEALQDSCWAEDCEQVTVVGGGVDCDQLQAGFSSFPIEGGIQFSNATTGTGFQTTWLWDFGDGTTSGEAQPFHVYTDPGIYEACLTAISIFETPSGPFTCVDTHCAVVTIGNASCSGFEVAMTWEPMPNNTAVFTATSSAPGTSFIWYFGDGTQAYGMTANHTYAAPGTYTVCVAGWYWNEALQDSCWAEDCEQVTVVGGGVDCDQLQAGFSSFPIEGGIQFSNATTGTGFQTTWLWDFGDGTTSAEAQPFHVYTDPGIYEACLTAISIFETPSGPFTCVDTHCAAVTIGDDACAMLSAAFEYTANGLAIQFVSATAGASPQSTFSWSFGDGATGSGPNPMHDYALPGTYEVCLHVESVYAFPGQPVVVCEDDICSVVVVGDVGPCDQHQAQFTSTAVGLLTQQFVSTSLGTTANTEYLWTFGDGSTAAGPDAVHTYPAIGVYEVCLRIQTVYEAFPGWPVIFCADSICYTVDVGYFDVCAGLEACFEPLPFENGAYLFENCSQLLPIAIPANYLWTFGDGTTSTEASPTHGFGPGVHTICLTVTQGNCVDTTCTTIIVGGGPDCDPGFDCSFTWTSQGPAVVFIASTTLPSNGMIWFFDDGTQGSGAIVTHLYEPPGPYNVCLAAWYWNESTQDSCWAEHCQAIDPFGSVGMNDDSGLDAVRIFPIPATDHLVISGVSAGTSITLFTSDGRQALTAVATQDRFTLPIDGLSAGSYVLRLEGPESAVVRRVVIQ